MNQQERGGNHEDFSSVHSLECLVGNLKKVIEEKRIDSKVVLVGLGGYTALGKSTLSHHLASVIPGASILPADGYILDREERARRGVSGDDPRATDFGSMAKDIGSLVSGDAVVTTDYDHSTGRHTNSCKIGPADFVIVDGTCALYRELNVSFDLKIFLDADPLIWYDLLKKVVVSERGYSMVDFNKQWPVYLRDRQLFVEKSGQFADIICLVGRNRKYQSEVVDSCSCDLTSVTFRDLGLGW